MCMYKRKRVYAHILCVECPVSILKQTYPHFIILYHVYSRGAPSILYFINFTNNTFKGETINRAKHL